MGIGGMGDTAKRVIGCALKSVGTTPGSPSHAEHLDGLETHVPSIDPVFETGFASQETYGFLGISPVMRSNAESDPKREPSNQGYSAFKAGGSDANAAADGFTPSPTVFWSS